MSNLLPLAIAAARAAGEAILSVYKRRADVRFKLDGSPLTIADEMAHNVITAALAQSGIPIVSEESEDHCAAKDQYWLVDPLDGTKDFLAANDEFTVNIALVLGNAPVMGVVFAPALDELYAGGRGLGAWMEKYGTRTDCGLVPRSKHCRLATSRFHDHPDVDIFAAVNSISHRVAVGSALKYGQLATAAVDVFPRLVGSSEWDTAAGQAVLEAAGGQVLDWGTGKPLTYGKASRRNPRLLAFRSPYAYSDFLLTTYETDLQ